MTVCQDCRAATQLPDSEAYAGRPCYGELIAVVLAGAGHVFTEIVFSETIGHLYNLAVSVAFFGYLVWRVRRTRGVFRIWGMRRDNFRTALRAQLAFGAIGALVMLSFGAASGSLALPATFWMTLALYPVWGVAQQFALQNLIARNLAGLLSSPFGIAVAASILFALSHYPRLDLVGLTLVAGVFFTLIYRRHPNLWAVGVAHAMLGSLAVYIVLREDPGAAILGFLFGT